MKCRCLSVIVSAFGDTTTAAVPVELGDELPGLAEEVRPRLDLGEALYEVSVLVCR